MLSTTLSTRSIPRGFTVSCARFERQTELGAHLHGCLCFLLPPGRFQQRRVDRERPGAPLQKGHPPCGENASHHWYALRVVC
jgi:hypothetical protein